MTDEKDKKTEEESDLENPSIPNTDGLSLVDDDKPANPPVDDFDFDLDEITEEVPPLAEDDPLSEDFPAPHDALSEYITGQIENDGENEDKVKELELKLMGSEYGEDFPEPEPHEALSEDFTGHIEDDEKTEQASENDELAGLDIPEGAEVEIIEESYMDAPFAEEPDDPHEEFALNDEDEDEEIESTDEGKQKSSILQALARPENAIKQAFQESNIRQKLLESNEWYRVRDENQRMEDDLEQTYGGAAKQGISPRRFFRNNLLVSLLLIILAGTAIRFGLGVYFPELLPFDDSADNIIASTPASKKKKTKSIPGEKVVKVNYLNKAEINSFLSHCLILPESRQIIDQHFVKTGYEFTDRKLTLAHEELKNFIAVYHGLDISFQVQDAIDRIGMLSHTAMPVIYHARDKASAYQDDLEDIRKQVAGIEQQLETLNFRRQDTATVNKQIKLRSELDKLNDKLRKGPREEEFTSLNKILDALDEGLTSQIPLQRLAVEDPAEELPYWYTSLPDADADNFKMALKETVLPEIALHGNALSPALAELSRFHIRELTIKLDELYLVASRIMYAPENLLDTFNKDIHGVDNRLNTLLGKEQVEWLSFTPCLKQARNESIH
jgi:hypothetical protein